MTTTAIALLEGCGSATLLGLLVPGVLPVFWLGNSEDLPRELMIFLRVGCGSACRCALTGGLLALSKAGEKRLLNLLSVVVVLGWVALVASVNQVNGPGLPGLMVTLGLGNGFLAGGFAISLTRKALRRRASISPDMESVAGAHFETGKPKIDPSGIQETMERP